MAFVSSFNISLSLRNTSAAACNSLSVRLSVENPLSNQPLTRVHPSRSVLTFARRRNPRSAIASTAASKKKRKKRQLPRKDVTGEEAGDLDEDAFELLFKQLEEDLKNDDPSMVGDDEEISEEDLAKLERELEEAVGEDRELLQLLNSTADDVESDVGVKMGDETDDEDEKEEEDGDDDEEEQEEEVKLRNWQIRRLASALKTGRRKTSIKSLAGELGLDRAVVLKLLRDPPPNILLICASLPDKPLPVISEPEAIPVESVSAEKTEDVVEHETKAKEPVHVMQGRWSAQKRLKKVQVETLERVYRRTKRPTNTMISSIVHVTNLPRKRVVKWFEDKRVEDGIPVHRLPYQRSAPETVFSK